MTDLIALAERVEEATGPDRELDCFVDFAAGHEQYVPFGPEDRPFRPQRATGVSVPRYTSSLDAAMTLIPEGWGFRLVRSSVKSRGARVSMWHQEEGPKPYADAATPALALTAAALKARAAMEAVDGQGAHFNQGRRCPRQRDPLATLRDMANCPVCGLLLDGDYCHQCEREIQSPDPQARSKGTRINEKGC